MFARDTVINVVLRPEEKEECVVKIHDYGERVAITCANRFSRDRLCCTAERFSNSKHRSLLATRSGLVWIKVLNIERCVVASSGEGETGRYSLATSSAFSSFGPGIVTRDTWQRISEEYEMERVLCNGEITRSDSSSPCF